MQNKRKISRRRFIGESSCAAIGFSTFMSSLLSLKAIGASALNNSALGPDYKALVCFSLSGGCDSYNMLIPSAGTAYNDYSATRNNLAINQNDLLGLSSSGASLALHPQLVNSQSLFNTNKNLAFLANIGTLVQPTTKSDLFNDTAQLPLGLYSHSDQYQQWQTGLTTDRSTKGWGGKVADLIGDMNTNQELSMNISLSGTNVFQVGNETVEYTIDPYNGSVGIYGYKENDGNYFNDLRTRAVDSLLEHNYQDAFKKTYVDVIKNAQAGHEFFQQALAQATNFDAIFSDTYLSNQFKMIARTISVQEQLGVKRQTFYVDFGGWDHHDEALSNGVYMFNMIDQALSEFNQAMELIMMSDQVTTFSISEFGRTLTSNGNGTDHAWSGNAFVMGGAVNGGEVYGNYPSLALGSEREFGNGSIIPELSTDEYFAELALWFGVAKSELPILFPTLSNFYNISSTENPIGFLNI